MHSRGLTSGTSCSSRSRVETDHREHGAGGLLRRLSDRQLRYLLMRRRFNVPALYRNEGLTHTHREGDLVERAQPPPTAMIASATAMTRPFRRSPIPVGNATVRNGLPAARSLPGSSPTVVPPRRNAASHDALITPPRPPEITTAPASARSADPASKRRLDLGRLARSDHSDVRLEHPSILVDKVGRLYTDLHDEWRARTSRGSSSTRPQV